MNFPACRAFLRTALYAAIGLTLPALAQQSPADDHHHDDAKALDRIVITASPLRPGAEEVAQPASVLTGAALDRQKAATLGETVAREPGIQTSYFGPGVGRPIIRGMEGARVQVLEGGTGSLDVSTVSADHAVSIEPFLADQIEILKGPATLLYGSGAIGGAVNVVDGRIPEQSPGAALSGRAEIRANSVSSERTAMARLDGGSDRFAWHGDAFSRDTGNYRIPGRAVADMDEQPGKLENSALETQGGALGGSWIEANGFAGMAISTYRSLYGIPGPAEEEGPVRIDLDQTRLDFKGGLQQPLPGFESATARLTHNDYQHVELEGQEVGTRFSNKGTEGRIDLVHDTWAGWHGAWGLQTGHRDFEALGDESFVPPSRGKDMGVFALEERQFEAWKLELGGRYDRSVIAPNGDFAQRKFDAVSASASMLWQMNEQLHWSLGFDRAERSPTAEELYSSGAHVATASFEQGDAGLDTETAHQIEAGLHVHWGALTGKIALYQNRFDDFIYLTETGEREENLPLRQWSQADATFKGFEAEAAWHLAENGAGIFDLRLFGDKVNARLNDGGPLPRIAPARLGANLQWQRDAWSGSIGAVRYAGQNRVAAFENPTPGYTLADAHLAYHIDTDSNAWEIFFDGTNLTNREARIHTSFLKDVAPLPGRGMAIGVRVFF